VFECTHPWRFAVISYISKHGAFNIIATIYSIAMEPSASTGTAAPGAGSTGPSAEKREKDPPTPNRKAKPQSAKGTTATTTTAAATAHSSSSNSSNNATNTGNVATAGGSGTPSSKPASKVDKEKDKDKISTRPDRKGKSGSGATRRERPAPKTLYKIVIRKLPMDSTYDIEKFRACVEKVCSKLSVESSHVSVDHFLAGKLSRKRGPVTSVGYISVDEDTVVRQLLTNCPKIIPFIEGRALSVPFIVLCDIFSVLTT
jgi:hypothetical protein